MTVSVGALARQDRRAATNQWARVYGVGLAFWLLTRWLVLVHQGAWPWMNAFVVAAARGIVGGDWNDAVRPQLPAVLGVPMVLAGASEQQMVAALYLVASLVQYTAFVVFLRALFPGRLQEQTLALLVFLVLPFNHSIHHYRDMPVVLASAAIFLLGADLIRATREDKQLPLSATPHRSRGSPPLPSARGEADAKRLVSGLSWRRMTYIVALMLLGIWSRIEMLTFVGILVVALIVVLRRRALSTVIAYGGAALAVTLTLLVVYRIENVDLSQAWFYTAHTFLDSTPDSWLSPECRAAPTENCREADGLGYFGPADLRAGVLALAANHPLITAAKSVRSAWDNAWVLFGPNLSTFPGIVPFVVVGLALLPKARELYGELPLAAWAVCGAVVAESVLPPLTWAPPHPQYHVALVLPMVVLITPLLLVLMRLPRARLVALAFFILNAGLSAFRYTRYAGY